MRGSRIDHRHHHYRNLPGRQQGAEPSNKGVVKLTWDQDFRHYNRELPPRCGQVNHRPPASLSLPQLRTDYSPGLQLFPKRTVEQSHALNKSKSTCRVETPHARDRSIETPIREVTLQRSAPLVVRNSSLFPSLHTFIDPKQTYNKQRELSIGHCGWTATAHTYQCFLFLRCSVYPDPRQPSL